MIMEKNVLRETEGKDLGSTGKQGNLICSRKYDKLPDDLVPRESSSQLYAQNQAENSHTQTHLHP